MGWSSFKAVRRSGTVASSNDACPINTVDTRNLGAWATSLGTALRRSYPDGIEQAAHTASSASGRCRWMSRSRPGPCAMSPMFTLRHWLATSTRRGFGAANEVAASAELSARKARRAIMILAGPASACGFGVKLVARRRLPTSRLDGFVSNEPGADRLPQSAAPNRLIETHNEFSSQGMSA